MHKPPKETHGFSLIELSIVMAVMSMMATALVPNMLAQHQEKLVVATVDAYYHIADAAQAYHTANGNWPGFENVGDDCDPDTSGDSGLEVLAADGYIHSATLANPWQDGGGAQVFTLLAVPLPTGCVLGVDPCKSCGLELASGNIPTSAQNMLTKLLPFASCDIADICTAEMTAGDGAGGDALPTGAIIMTEDAGGCPAGFTEVNELQGRFPVGAGNNGSTHGVEQFIGKQGGISGFALMGGGHGGTRGFVDKIPGADLVGDVVTSTNAGGSGLILSQSFNESIVGGVPIETQAYKGYAFTKLMLQQESFSAAGGWNGGGEKINVNTGTYGGGMPDGMFVGGATVDHLVASPADALYSTRYLQINPPNYAVVFCKKI